MKINSRIHVTKRGVVKRNKGISLKKSLMTAVGARDEEDYPAYGIVEEIFKNKPKSLSHIVGIVQDYTGWDEEDSINQAESIWKILKGW